MAAAATKATTTPGNTREEAVTVSSPTNDYEAPQLEDEGPSSDDGGGDESTTTLAQSEEVLVWRKPWMIALAFFFSFYGLWFYGAIIKRYWIDEKWDMILPGFSTSYFTKFSIRLHMTCGGVAIICSPIQMVTPFTSGWKKAGINWYRRLHRVSGRIYVAGAILSFFFGQWFILLKEFVLVGGLNMGLAFSFAGLAIAYFAYMTWKTAPSRAANRGGDSGYTVEDHRNYAIRSFSQIIAPFLYRYWYTLLVILGVYRTPRLLGGDVEKGENLVCDDRGVCADYERPFDAIFCWLYWISSWMVAEVIIACLPKHQKQQRVTVSSAEGEAEVPLLNTATDTNTSTTEPPTSGDTQEEIPSASAISCDNNNRSILVVNLIGCLMAVLAIAVSGPILLATITKMGQGLKS